MALLWICPHSKSGTDTELWDEDITSSSRYTPSETLRSKLHLMTLSQRREVFQLSLVHRCIHGGAPKYLCTKFMLNRELQYARTRGQNNIHLGRPCTNFYRNSFEFQAALSWNRLPSELKELTNSAAFKKAVRAYTVL